MCLKQKQATIHRTRIRSLPKGKEGPEKQTDQKREGI